MARGVNGTDIVRAKEDVMGEINLLLIEKDTGGVASAVMSFCGVLDLAHSHCSIPWSAVKYDTKVGGFRTRIAEGQLRDAQEFSADSNRAWETRAHERFSVPVYWRR